ncbi:MAG: iron-containing alcohol dehydrogenase [Clostridiales bacterium]|nr:iron-containing alcohol dehydrogenase [Clostridiales bacterium]
MNDFIFHNPIKVYFCKSYLKKLPGELLAFGKKVLLLYGGGSVKKNGLYDEIIAPCKENGVELFELSGVKPNIRSLSSSDAEKILGMCL